LRNKWRHVACEKLRSASNGTNGWREIHTIHLMRTNVDNNLRQSNYLGPLGQVLAFHERNRLETEE
jgi:hypothetical protein